MKAIPGKCLVFYFFPMPVNLTYIVPCFRHEEFEIQKRFDITILCGRPVS